MKVAVLCGGLSPERNVSKSSGTKVAAALNKKGHQAVLIDMYFGLEDYEGEISEIFSNPPALFSAEVGEVAPDLEKIKNERKLKSDSQFGVGVLEVCQMADIVFVALHGQCGEDGKLQATFDLLGIKYTGSGFLGSAISMDKDVTKKMLIPHGIKTPAWQVLDSEEMTVEKIIAEIEIPLVIKPVDSGSSVGVSIAFTKKELEEAVKQSVADGGRYIIEQYVSGREIQIAVLGAKALPSIEIITHDGFYDYKNKYKAGLADEVCPSEIMSEQESYLAKTVEKIFEILDLSAYCRADFILDDKGEFWFLEMNTLPGMTPTSLMPQEAAASGIGYEELCEKIIEYSLEKYK